MNRDLTILHRLCIRREALARKNRDFAEGLLRSKYVQNLLLPVRSQLRNLYSSHDNDVEARRLFSLGEDEFPFLEGLVNSDRSELLDLFWRQTLEKGNIPYEAGDFHGATCCR